MIKEVEDALRRMADFSFFLSSNIPCKKLLPLRLQYDLDRPFRKKEWGDFIPQKSHGIWNVKVDMNVEHNIKENN